MQAGSRAASAQLHNIVNAATRRVGGIAQYLHARQDRAFPSELAHADRSARPGSFEASNEIK